MLNSDPFYIPAWLDANNPDNAARRKAARDRCEDDERREKRAAAARLKRTLDRRAKEREGKARLKEENRRTREERAARKRAKTEARGAVFDAISTDSDTFGKIRTATGLPDNLIKLALKHLVKDNMIKKTSKRRYGRG